MIVNIAIFVFLYWLFRYIIVPLLLVLFNHYILTIPKKHVKLLKESGKWAVVTGATDGIGREYCRQLAKLGLDIFLVSRNVSKLEATSKELKQYYKVNVKYAQADFTSNSIYERLNESLKDLDIGVLVNNVGMVQPYPTTFNDFPGDFSLVPNMINCNILSAVAMTKIVLTGMCARRRGIIINISSVSSIFPFPMSAMYSSSKAYLTHFSRTINTELSSSGVLVQTVQPAYVQTNLLGEFRPPKIITATAEEYVESAIQTVGIESDTYGTLVHSIQGILLSSIPWQVAAQIFKSVRKYRVKMKSN